MDLELRHLRAIITLADELSFSRAADRLGLPQSALSSQLVRIERALGVSLFDRTTRSVWPTPAAELLLPAARAAAAAVRDFESGARSLRAETPPELRAAAGADLVGPLSDALRPVEFVTYTVSEAALHAVSTGAADLAIGYDYPASPFRPARQVRCGTVGTDPMWVALPAGHRLAGETTLQLVDLADETWASWPPGTDGEEYHRELCHAAGFHPNVRYTTSSPAVGPELVAGGSCVALVSPLTPVPESVRLVPLLPGANRRTVLAWQPARCPTALADAVRIRLAARHRELVAGLDGYASRRTTSSATAVMPASVG